MFALWRTPGAPDTVKYDTFGTPGALSQKTHTHIGPGCVLAIKKWPVLPPKHTHTPPSKPANLGLWVSVIGQNGPHTHGFQRGPFRPLKIGRNDPRTYTDFTKTMISGGPHWVQLTFSP